MTAARCSISDNNCRKIKILVTGADGLLGSNLVRGLFIKETKGSLVFISSIAGKVGLPSASAYSGGKMMLTALAQSLQAELAGSGMHIGIVYVGFTRNDDTKRVLNAQGDLVPVAKRSAYLQQTQDQVAGAVLKLIRKRRFSTVLSLTGKLSALAIRLFSGLVLRILRVLQEKHRYGAD